MLDCVFNEQSDFVLWTRGVNDVGSCLLLDIVLSALGVLHYIGAANQILYFRRDAVLLLEQQRVTGSKHHSCCHRDLLHCHHVTILVQSLQCDHLCHYNNQSIVFAPHCIALPFAACLSI